MKILWRWVLSAVAIVVAAYLVPNVTVESFGVALIVAIVLGLINISIKPALKLITLPLNILTLGLVGILINTLLIMLADRLVEGFTVTSLVPALIFGIVLGVVNWILSAIK